MFIYIFNLMFILFLIMTPIFPKKNISIHIFMCLYIYVLKLLKKLRMFGALSIYTLYIHFYTRICWMCIKCPFLNDIILYIYKCDVYLLTAERGNYTDIYVCIFNFIVKAYTWPYTHKYCVWLYILGRLYRITNIRV